MTQPTPREPAGFCGALLAFALALVVGASFARPVGDWRVGADVFNAQHELRYLFPEDDIHLRRIARGSEGFSRVPNYHDWGWKQFDIVRHHLEWELTPDPQYGWFPKDKQDIYELEMLRAKMWRFGRVIIDSGLHTGRFSYDEAFNLESNTLGFVRRGAQINIDSITEGGSRTFAPTLGYFQWMLLREDYFQKMQELDQKGALKEFHDRVYRIGFLPVVLVRQALFHQLEEEFGI